MCNLSKIDRQTKEAAAMPVAVGTPKRTEQMFQALKKHILRERQKKKQEQEADAEVERQRKERELQQKQDVMTLGENREQISHLEQVLAQLKDEKHQLFLQLKKVLNEDDIRRRQLVRQHEPSTDVMDIYGGLYSGVPTMSGHLSHLVMPSSYAQPALSADRNAIYKVPQTHSLLTPSSIKRPRSPSPPPQMTFHQNYSPKPPPPQQRVSYQNVKHPLQENVMNNAISSPIVFPEPGYSYYAGSGSGGGNAGASTPQGSYGVYQGGSSTQYTGPGPTSSRNEQDTGPKQHPLYLSQPMPRASNISQGYIHGGSLDHKVSYPEDKYYPVSGVRGSSQVPVQGGGIPIQQPAQGAKTGGITSGYPIRPPTSHLPSPQTSNTSHGIYSSSVGPSSRLVYSQATTLPPSRYMQREV